MQFSMKPEALEWYFLFAWTLFCLKWVLVSVLMGPTTKTMEKHRKRIGQARETIGTQKKAIGKTR